MKKHKKAILNLFGKWDMTEEEAKKLEDEIYSSRDDQSWGWRSNEE